MIEGRGTEFLILLDLVAVFGAAKLLEEPVARVGQPTVLGLVNGVYNVAPIA